ncbi:hypothetical protein FB451DRAFT_1418951 [Mycena latifolia]|nr:hypothetical protein FB451DRAFT_1418951 [Mycena latifolia]
MPASKPSFDDMMDMPLDSSPLKSSSRTTSPTPGTTAQPDPESPSPLSIAPLPRQRKRPAEDMSQYAGEVSRAQKLVKSDHDELMHFAALLSLGHHQSKLQPADAAWVAPKRLHNKIEANAAILLADCSIPAYRNAKIGPSKLLMDKVFANPDWGFTEAMKDEKDAIDGLISTVSKVLINKRSAIKTVILGSLGSDPIDGATLRPGALNIVDLAKLFVSKLKVRTKVDAALCGRLAVLRKLISEQNDNKYWGEVDKKGRAGQALRPREPIQWMLDPDFATYGMVNLTDLSAAPRTVPTASTSAPAVRAVTSRVSQPSAAHSGSGENDDDDDA